MKKSTYLLVLAGSVFGIFFSLLIKLGNPPNMGVCAICFTRDIVGALGWHKVEKLAYIRPEIVGFILGAFISGLIFKSFKPTGGSSSLVRFFVGMFIGIGGLVFLGCPIRMLGRLAGGDPTALVGLVGLGIGIWGGVELLKRGFTLEKEREVSKVSGVIIPLFMIFLLILGLTSPKFLTLGLPKASPFWVSLVVGVVIGVLGERGKLCFVGWLKHIFLTKSGKLIWGVVSFFLWCLVLNVVLGQFKWGNSPIAHHNHIANLLGMIMVGLGCVLIGGCPFKHMILAGVGNTDSGITFLGIMIGTAVAHNFNLIGAKGIWACVVGIGFLILIGIGHRERG
jgi:hypothetical protein